LKVVLSILGRLQPEVDLYPEALRGEIDGLNQWIYPQINNGVYRCGFSQQQGPYEEAFECAAAPSVIMLLAKMRHNQCLNSSAKFRLR